MGPIWDPSGQPAYGLTHMGPMPNPVALPIWDPYRPVCWDVHGSLNYEHYARECEFGDFEEKKQTNKKPSSCVFD